MLPLQATRSQGMIVANATLAGAAEISAEGIKKHFRSTEPIQAIFELVWNGFDAGATDVRIDIERNELGSITAVTVSDNGEGIDFDDQASNFGLFNESKKKDDVAQHGSQGKGRLAFHKLAHAAAWHTRRKGEEATIKIDATDIKRFTVERKQHGAVNGPSGTTVVLSHIHEPLPEHDKLIADLSNVFGWRLVLDPSKRLLLQKEAVPVPSHEIHREALSLSGNNFDLTVIRWDDKPTSEKSFVYLLDSKDRMTHKEHSTLNNKPNFFTSVFVRSSWADSFAPAPDLLKPGANTLSSREWSEVNKKVAAITRNIYDDFLRRYVDAEIARFEEDGVFPTFTGLEKADADWRLNNAKAVVRSIYLADPAVFNSLNKKQKKILVRLLDRLSVSNENDSLLEILNNVLDLDKESVEKLASQLQKTTLENIVNTIEVLQRRQATLHELRHLMNEHYADVLETPDLQKIIESNTWLFGPQYEILGAEEASFTQISRKLRAEIHRIDEVDGNDIEDDATIDGAKRQPDLFLARKVLSFDSFNKPVYRCVIVEIKRPSIALNIKHLRQLEDYAAILRRYPEFSSEHMRFELILVGRKISNQDTEIEARLREKLASGEPGLVMNDGKTKRYVVSWYTLLDSHELANRALLDTLRMKRDDLEGVSRTALVDRLQGVQSADAADTAISATAH